MATRLHLPPQHLWMSSPAPLTLSSQDSQSSDGTFSGSACCPQSPECTGQLGSPQPDFHRRPGLAQVNAIQLSQRVLAQRHGHMAAAQATSQLDGEEAQRSPVPGPVLG